jgi:hypothetical protein
MGCVYLFGLIGVRGLNVKAAAAGADAAFEFRLSLKCSKWVGVTMPGFEKIYRLC